MAFIIELQSRFMYGLQKELSKVNAILSCSSIKKKIPQRRSMENSSSSSSSHFTQFFLQTINESRS